MFAQGLRITLSMAIVSLLIIPPVFAADSVVAQAETSAPEPEKKAKLVDLWQPGDSGQRMNIRGRVTSLDGTPLPGIRISIRQANGDGDYTDRYRTTLTTDAKGLYQFGSVVPNNYSGARHVHVTVYEDGWQYFDMSILFEGDPNLEYHYQDGKPIFLEESTVKGETILFGRFDIVLTPD
ncbi:MAG: carboxypeptidase regulatory-like domain-containing protein [Gammaproteobacteria bacterium]|nr:carboxypeptidase regulatory-like domain-containing protein [Gammaproteobacteria bacterium]MDH3447537.1 carboxypeptidase regulatory-like domain-containing protein [Gammaproteobacteria bacterium]